MTKCTLTFPGNFPTEYKNIFCQLQEAKSAFDRSEYTNTTGAVRTSHPTIPLYFQLNTTTYTNHPTEVYSAGSMKPLSQYVTANGTSTTIGVSAVESVGNGDQGSFWNSNAKNGNLYLLTSPGKCQDLSPKVSYTDWRLNDFDQALRTFKFSQETYNGKGPELSVFGFPKSVSEAKKTLPVMVTVLPGPSATHVPSGQEGQPGVNAQGEWPLAWSAMTYLPAKPAAVYSAQIPYEFLSTLDRCSRVVQGHGDSTPIIQFTWNTVDILLTGGLTVAHDIGNYKAVLRGNAAETTPSVFKISLVRM